MLRARASQGDDVSLSGGARDFAAFGLVHRVHDPRAVFFFVLRDEVDLIGEVFDAAFGHARVQQQRAAELHLIAAGEFLLFDLLAVDERAVRAVQDRG